MQITETDKERTISILIAIAIEVETTKEESQHIIELIKKITKLK